KNWDPRPPWSEIHAAQKRVKQHVPRLLDVLHELAPAGSLADLLIERCTPGSSVEESTLRIAQAATKRVLAGLQSGDTNLCLQGAVALAGLGGGLTPSGDDWLVGCMLAAWIMLPHSRAESLASLLGRAAARRTTPLSAAWLRTAARGECGIRWHRLFHALSADDPAVVMEAARSIIQQGHTSGSDALAGFVATLAAS
ncbi:MAG: DUF2877 domain-containing protein, partial [Anaerolineae bacterium]|nr:DUF2877 domain-containing protein [Anaerolineae bacterium]